jgi:hypothetical protein
LEDIEEQQTAVGDKSTFSFRENDRPYSFLETLATTGVVVCLYDNSIFLTDFLASKTTCSVIGNLLPTTFEADAVHAIALTNAQHVCNSIATLVFHNNIDNNVSSDFKKTTENACTHDVERTWGLISIG